jgi:hypothetical protein
VIWLAVWAVAVAPAVGVEGGAACPSPTDVAARLYALLPAAGVAIQPGPDVARIDLQGDQVSIVLRRPDGTLVGARALPAQGTCADQARAAAVVLATWASDVHPEFRVPQPPPPAALPPAIPTLAALAAAPPPVAPHRRWQWDLGAGVSAVRSGDQSVLGARLIGALLSARGWGFRLALAGEGDRSTTTGPGQAIWSRWSAALGPEVRWPLAKWALDAHLSFEGALFRARGAGFPVSYEDRGVDSGVAGGLRLLIPGLSDGTAAAASAGGWRPWVAVDGTRWLGQRTVRETVDGQERPLATWMVAGSLGFSFLGQ